MSHYLGFARSFGGDVTVMTWLTGHKAKEFDTWLKHDLSGKANITMTGVPAVLVDGFCPFTSKKGRWIEVMVHLNRTTQVTSWNDQLNRLLKGESCVTRTIRVTLRHDRYQTPLLFQRNGDLWMSDPRPGPGKNREDTLLLNMIEIAGPDAYPSRLQPRITDYFPPIQWRVPKQQSAPAMLAIKSKEAEDVTPTKPGPSITRTAGKKLKLKLPRPFPKRKYQSPSPESGVGKYAIEITPPKKPKHDVVDKSGLKLVGTEDAKIKVITDIRPSPSMPVERATIVKIVKPRNPAPVDESMEIVLHDVPDPPMLVDNVIDAPASTEQGSAAEDPTSSQVIPTTSLVRNPFYPTSSSDEGRSSSMSIKCQEDIADLRSDNGHATTGSDSPHQRKTPLTLTQAERAERMGAPAAMSDVYPPSPSAKYFTPPSPGPAPIQPGRRHTDTSSFSSSDESGTKTPVSTPDPEKTQSLAGPVPPLPIPSPKLSSPIRASPFQLGLNILPKHLQKPTPTVVDPEAHKRATLPLPSTSRNQPVQKKPDDDKPQPETSADSMTAEPPSEERLFPEDSIPTEEINFAEDFARAAAIPKDEDEDLTKKEGAEDIKEAP